jgi:hypothetical protein
MGRRSNDPSRMRGVQGGALHPNARYAHVGDPGLRYEDCNLSDQSNPDATQTGCIGRT